MSRRVAFASQSFILNPSSSILNPSGTSVAASERVRRILALAGFILVIALAVTLLYRVYIHHTEAEPYSDEESSIVGLDRNNYSELALSDSSDAI
ncbi:MAG TPA: hypothetical protein VF846_00705 [Thermoanaerobaculia bacterium]